MAENAYSTVYAVHQTSHLLRAFEVTRVHTEYRAARVFVESLLIGLSVIAGKIRVLPGVQYLQQTHGSNESIVRPRIVDRGRRKEFYERYKTALVAEITRNSGCSLLDAGMLVEQNGSLVPGHAGSGRSRISRYRKVRREFVRIGRPLAARISRSDDRHRPIVLRNSDLLPDSPAGRMALNQIQSYPTGLNQPLTDPLCQKALL